MRTTTWRRHRRDSLVCLGAFVITEVEAQRGGRGGGGGGGGVSRGGGGGGGGVSRSGAASSGSLGASRSAGGGGVSRSGAASSGSFQGSAASQASRQTSAQQMQSRQQAGTAGVRPAARPQPNSCRPGSRRVLQRTAKTGSSLASNSKRVDSRRRAPGKKTGKRMGIMPGKTGKSMGKGTTEGVMGAGIPLGESPPGW
jgi:hypothetical protein